MRVGCGSLHPRPRFRESSDVEDERCGPAAVLPVEVELVAGDGLDLVVEDVAIGVHGLAPDGGFEAGAVVEQVDVESGIKAVAGFAEKNRLVEPGHEKVASRVGLESDGVGDHGPDVVSVGHDVVEEGLGGGDEEVVEIIRSQAEADIGGVVDQLAFAHDAGTCWLANPGHHDRSFEEFDTIVG